MPRPPIHSPFPHDQHDLHRLLGDETLLSLPTNTEKSQPQPSTRSPRFPQRFAYFGEAVLLHMSQKGHRSPMARLAFHNKVHALIPDVSSFNCQRSILENKPDRYQHWKMLMQIFGFAPTGITAVLLGLRLVIGLLRPLTVVTLSSLCVRHQVALSRAEERCEYASVVTSFIRPVGPFVGFRKTSTVN